jgi:hypothetical protein
VQQHEDATDNMPYSSSSSRLGSSHKFATSMSSSAAGGGQARWGGGKSRDHGGSVGDAQCVKR